MFSQMKFPIIILKMTCIHVHVHVYVCSKCSIGIEPSSALDVYVLLSTTLDGQYNIDILFSCNDRFAEPK